jgi:hypothetical protein
MIIDLSTSFVKNSVKYSELIAAVIGTIYFYKYKHTHIKYFLYLLWYITLTEFFAVYARKTGTLIFYTDENGIHYTTWFYNLLRFVTFNTLLFIYFNYLSTKKYKQCIKIFAFGYIAVSIINWLFIQNFILEKSEIPRILGSIFLICTIIFYFIELLKSEKILVFHRLLLFWISVGLLLFYTGTIPFVLKYNGYALIPGVHKLFLIIYLLAITMYLTFAFGFIWSKKE